MILNSLSAFCIFNFMTLNPLSPCSLSLPPNSALN